MDNGMRQGPAYNESPHILIQDGSTEGIWPIGEEHLTRGSWAVQLWSTRDVFRVYENDFAHQGIQSYVKALFKAYLLRG